MSYLTEAVIHVDYDPGDVARHHITTVPIEHEVPQFFAKICTESAGGSKVFCGDLYAACFNHVRTDEILKYLEAVPWGGSAAATIIEEDGRVTVWKRGDA